MHWTHALNQPIAHDLRTAAGLAAAVRFDERDQLLTQGIA